MNPRRFARALALLAIVVVTAWLCSPRPDLPPVVVPPAPTPGETAAVPSPGAAPAVPTSPATPALPASVLPATPVANPPGLPASPPGTANTPPSQTPVVPANRLAPDLASAAVAVDQVRLMLRDYRTLTGENPVGTNAEIMRALMGDNPRQAKLGPPEGQTLNDDGELVDRWGTPLFFHQLSRTVMEIRSAGPDKVMWTEDDIIAR